MYCLMYCINYILCVSHNNWITINMFYLLCIKLFCYSQQRKLTHLFLFSPSLNLYWVHPQVIGVLLSGVEHKSLLFWLSSRFGFIMLTVIFITFVENVFLIKYYIAVGGIMNLRHGFWHISSSLESVNTCNFFLN